MRNIFQSMIDARKGQKQALVGVKVFAAELLRSQYDALLASPEGSEERARQEWLQGQIKEALAEIDKLCGWA